MISLHDDSNAFFNILFQAIQTHYSGLDAERGPHLKVGFERDRISLELPGSDLLNGWTITPLVPPVVRLCHFGASEIV